MPPSQQGQPGHVGQRPEDDGHWYERQFLGESMAIEIPPDPAKKSEQLMANENLTKEANGAMAPMTGSERSLVATTATRFMLFCQFALQQQLAGIPCFHCFQMFMSTLRFPQLVHQLHPAFLRAINHGCLPGGQPPMEVRKDDPCWDLIQNGWSCLIWSHLVEGQWPMLPTLLQGTPSPRRQMN